MKVEFLFKQSYQKQLLIVFCCLMFIYVLLRALNVPFTFDEITTSQIVESQNWTEFGNSANNHLLNTLLIKGAIYFFDSSVFIYRLPNVLAFGLFLIYSVKLGNILTSSNSYLTILLLVSMPFLIDFFSLSRGYGLSISFLVTSIYFVLSYSKSLQTYQWLMAVIFGICAVLSNYTLLHFFLPLLFVLLIFIVKAKEKIVRNLILFVTIVIVFFVELIPILFQLRDGQHLIFGGRDSFFSSVVLSLGRCFGYGVINIQISEVVFTILFAIALSFSIIQLIGSIRDRKITSRIILPVLFILTILSPISQHILFGTFYPAERTALLYYPLMILSFIQGIDVYFKRLNNVILKVMSFVFVLLLIASFNLSHTYSWRYESGTVNAMKYLRKISQGENEKIILGLDYLYTPSTWFYQYKSNFDKLETHEVIGCCWEFNMEIEELNPKYYGAGEYSKMNMSKDDIDRIFKDNFDYYYLNGYTVKELSRNNVKFHIVHSERNANSYIIKF